MEDRNVCLKTKLASVLINDLEREQLIFLEAFQNRFLKCDGQITLLKHEVNELRQMINEVRHVNHLPAVDTVRQGVCNRISKTQKDFEKLNADFNNYILRQFPAS